MLFTPGQWVSSGRIVVPEFICAALGLHNHMALHMLPLGAGDGPTTEVVASIVPQNRWHDVWRLEVSLRDKPGLMANLTKALTTREIDILGMRGVTLDRGRATHFEFTLDATRYVSRFEGTVAERVGNPFMPLMELKAWLVAGFIEDLVFVTPDKPMLAIRRNLPLFEASGASARSYLAHIKSGTLDIAHLIANGEGPPTRAAPARRVVCYLVAEEDHLILRMYFVSPNSGYCHLRMFAKSGLGTLSRTSLELRRRGFNIHQAYARRCASFDRYAIDFLVHLEEPRKAARSDDEVRAKIDALVTKHLPKSLGCTHEFPAVFDSSVQPAAQFCRR